MKHYLVTAAMRFLGDLRRMWMIGQNGQGQGITKIKDSFGGRGVAGNIVQNYGKARACNWRMSRM
jgi:hypothetical protein